MTYLYAAYTATWIIHITYLIFLVRSYTKVRREMEELSRK